MIRIPIYVGGKMFLKRFYRTCAMSRYVVGTSCFKADADRKQHCYFEPGTGYLESDDGWVQTIAMIRYVLP